MTKNDRLKGKKTLKINSFLNEFEKDEIKSKVKIVHLFNHFNINLTKKGKSFVALCPWHDDKTPSLSVDESKGLYNCFGCGESGDIFTLVEKMRECDFKEALKYLKDFARIENLETKSNEVTKNEKGEKPALKKEPVIEQNNQEKKTEPDSKNEEVRENEQEISINLNTVVDYYHKRLISNNEALSYLEKRGFYNKSNINRFKIGFCDGSLKDKLSKQAESYLLEKGVLRDSGEEHFKNFLTFPIYNELNQVVGIYGRSIKTDAERSRSIKHLYLKGEHRGVFNYKAGKVFDKIILTESIIDAFSLIEAGLENVQSTYGVNGFTDEHLKQLKDNRVKEITLGFDNDEAGNKSSALLKERLVKEGFSVKEIKPTLKDWSEDLCKNLPAGSAREEYLKNFKEEVLSKIKEAESFSLSENKDFKVAKENANYIFTTDELVYRVSGVKEIFVNNLRVNIKTVLRQAQQPPLLLNKEKDELALSNAEGEKYYDNLDLYSARSRTSYSNNLAKLFFLEPKQVEKDLISILEYLEDARDKNLNPQQETDKELTDEERELGLKFLKTPTMFDELVRDMETLGYVGDDLNKQLLYIAASSRKMDDPISVLIVSQSASGKSYLVETVKKLMPEDEYISVTSLSDQALNYMGDLEHKFLDLSEAVHNEVIEHQLREILSAKKLSRFVASKNEKTGETESKQIVTRAVVSMVMSTTNHKVNPENASRCFIIDTDESREQTRRIHEMQRGKHSMERIRLKQEVLPLIIKKHQAAQMLLKRVLIINEFAHLVDFPDLLMRTRRDHDRFIDLIASVCFLRQYQKELKLKDGLEYIECDLKDYEIAYNIMVNGVLSSSLFDLPKGAVMLHEEIIKMLKKKEKKTGVALKEILFIQRDVREFTGLGVDFVKKNIRLLADFEYLEITSGRNRGTRLSYRLRDDESIEHSRFEMIPKPEELAEKINSI